MLILECNEAMQLCYNMRYVWKVLGVLIKIFQWSIPVVLIVLGTIDMFKAMVAADEEKATAARTAFIKRLIYGIAIFLVPVLIRIILSFVNNNLINDSENEYGGALAWLSCWDHIDDEDDSFFDSQNCVDIYKKEEKKKVSTLESEISAQENEKSSEESTGSNEKKYKNCYKWDQANCASGTVLSSNGDICVSQYILSDQFINSNSCFDSDDDMEYFSEIFNMDNLINERKSTFECVCNNEFKSKPKDVIFSQHEKNGKTQYYFTCTYDYKSVKQSISSNSPTSAVGDKYEIYKCNLSSTCKDLSDCSYIETVKIHK